MAGGIFLSVIFNILVNVGLACSPSDFFQYPEAHLKSAELPGPMSSWEYEALNLYTQQDYDWINGDLRAGSTLSGNLLQFVSAIDSALLKTKRFVGRSFRGTSLPPAVLMTYQEGQVVQDLAYLSTSASYEVVMKKWSPSSFGIFMAIDGKSGRDIQYVAFLPEEEEVLFPRATKFRVISRCSAQTDSGKSYEVIHLKEK